MADKIDLNVPWTTPGTQNIEETDDADAEPVERTEEPEGDEPEDEPARVKYSRFKKFHDLALEAQAEAERWKAIAETRETKVEPEVDYQDEAYKLWIENYGDTEASHKAWKNQLKINEALSSRALSRAREEAIEAVRNERYEEAARTEKNIDAIDNGFDELGDELGRDLSAKEQSALLDIIDDYTPKDRDGNYAGPIMSFDRAWKIYSLENKSARSSSISSRNSIASISGSQSQGSPSASERDKNFNPLDWGAVTRRAENL